MAQRARQKILTEFALLSGAFLGGGSLRKFQALPAADSII